MTKQINIQEFAIKFLNGDFDAGDVKTQISAGWYDWFCRDTSLPAKTQKLGKKVLQLMKSNKIDCENHMVFFKNNAAGRGGLYDDFRICDMKTGEVLYIIILSDPYATREGNSAVYGHENNFDEPLIEGSWADIKKFFIAK